MELTPIVLRTLFMYVFVFLVMRIMGKREIGKLSVFDLVISIMIAEIAVIVIEEPDKHLGAALAPIVVLAVIQIALAIITLKSNKIRLWIEGKPSVLIRHGHLNRKEMRKQRYNLDDMMIQLRENGITDVGEVELAVLESSGKLSVIKKDEDTTNFAPGEGGDGSFGEDSEALPGKTDVRPKVRYELLPLALIMDGQVQDESLEKIGKTRFWLRKELQSYGVDHFKNVFFCSVDHKGKLYVDKKTRD